MTGWGRSGRRLLWVGAAPLLAALAGCGNTAATIPHASATPSPTSITIAPGVTVSPAKLALPPYSVSTSNPLPQGVSAKVVVRDFIEDNLIENQALEHSDATLLQYADAGAMLTLDQRTISTDQASGSRILEIDDTVNSLVVGGEKDPNNPAARAAFEVAGLEKMTTEDKQGTVTHKTDDFHVVIWVTWSSSLHKYLRCDVSTL
ncbi:MAG: hypothetical protein ACRENY_09860 [Candidatus Dormibacteria bacterium]